jgi:hypothetical protein
MMRIMARRTKAAADRASRSKSREARVVVCPSERAIDNQALGQNDEAMRRVAFDDLQLPAAGLGDGCGRLGSLIASIGKDAFDEEDRRRVRRSRTSRAPSQSCTWVDCRQLMGRPLARVRLRVCSAIPGRRDRAEGERKIGRLAFFDGIAALAYDRGSHIHSDGLPWSCIYPEQGSCD